MTIFGQTSLRSKKFLTFDVEYQNFNFNFMSRKFPDLSKVLSSPVHPSRWFNDCPLILMVIIKMIRINTSTSKFCSKFAFTSKISLKINELLNSVKIQRKSIYFSSNSLGYWKFMREVIENRAIIASRSLICIFHRKRKKNKKYCLVNTCFEMVSHSSESYVCMWKASYMVTIFTMHLSVHKERNPNKSIELIYSMSVTH